MHIGYGRSVTTPSDKPPSKPQPPGLIDILGSPSRPDRSSAPLSEQRRRAPRRLAIAGVVLIALGIALGLAGLKGVFGTVFLLGWFCLINAGFFAVANRWRHKHEQTIR
jgi:hypothetical protein